MASLSEFARGRIAPGEPTPGAFADWFAEQGAPSAGGAAPSGGAAPAGPATSDDLLQYFNSLTTGLPPGSESLVSLEPQLQARGIKVLRNAMGIAGKIQLPSGEIVDVGGAFSSGQPGQMRWQNLRDDPKFGGGGGETGQALARLQASPGYQFRLAEGAKALERSAAARGTLLTGGTLKGLQRYAQDYASGEFDKRQQQVMTGARLGLDATATGAAQASQYGANAGNLITDIGSAQSAGTTGSANAWNQGIGNAANTVMQQYYLSRLFGNQPGGPGYVQDDVTSVAGRINNSPR